MKCPRTAKGVETHSDGILTIMGDCLKEECAWWNKVDEHCRVAGIEVGLKAWTYALTKIAKELTLVRGK